MYNHFVATKPSGAEIKQGRTPGSGEKVPRAPSPASKMATKEPITDKTKGKELSEDGKSKQYTCNQIELMFGFAQLLKSNQELRKVQQVTR